MILNHMLGKILDLQSKTNVSVNSEFKGLDEVFFYLGLLSVRAAD